MPDEWRSEATAPILGGPRPNQERRSSIYLMNTRCRHGGDAGTACSWGRSSCGVLGSAGDPL